jgi:hypothetical protein
LSEHLQSYSREIFELAKIFAPLSSKRLPKTADFILFFLHAYVDCATGQPQWRGLATLLEAAYAGHGRCEEADEECLRKKIRAMNVNHTRECSRLRQKAQEYLDSGNGGWPSKQELEQIAMDVALELSREAYPEVNLPQ